MSRKSNWIAWVVAGGLVYFLYTKAKQAATAITSQPPPGNIDP